MKNKEEILNKIADTLIESRIAWEKGEVSKSEKIFDKYEKMLSKYSEEFGIKQFELIKEVKHRANVRVDLYIEQKPFSQDYIYFK